MGHFVPVRSVRKARMGGRVDMLLLSERECGTFIEAYYRGRYVYSVVLW
jgi:hypothetical protein